MNLQFRRTLVAFLRAQQNIDRAISNIQLNDDGSGHIAYSRDCVWIDPLAPGFTGSTVAITDEELVRAYLIARLAVSLGYCNPSNKIELERVYRPVGRPTGKGGRVDILVRGAAEDRDSHNSFLFIECKAPDKFDSDLKFIDGQLFRLSMQEAPRPRYLIYFTVELRGDRVRERSIVIDTLIFPTFEAWDQQGQPILSDLPASFGNLQKILYGNVESSTPTLLPLDRIASREQFSRLQSEIHDVI